MTFAETEKTELKREYNDTIAKEIVAFLNSDGGVIYIGVNDDGSVRGVDKLDETLKKIADVLENMLTPSMLSRFRYTAETVCTISRNMGEAHRVAMSVWALLVAP